MPFSQYNDNGGASNRWARPTPKVEPTQFDTAPIQKQIENASTRITDAGGKINPDKRNAFEKATNLPQGQNWLFDAFDLLGRPQQAFYNAVDSYRDGGKGLDNFKAMGEGLSGTAPKLYGSDFVGIDNKYGKAATGLALDVVLDPLNLVPGSLIKKGVSKAITPIKKGYKALETAIPSLEKGKDALGRAFVPDYKLGEDLYGRADDTVKNLKQQTENSINYMSEESVKNVADAARRAGGVKTGTDVGRLMEKDLTSSLPRPTRQMSTDPKTLKAADDLMKSNDDIRQWALSNGISVGEIDGYMKHVLSAEERARRKSVKAVPIDRGNYGLGQPNKKVIDPRKLEGSAEDVNDRFGRTMFEPNSYFATAIGQKQLIEYGNSVSFRRKVLSNNNFALPYSKGTAVPNNAVVIDTNNYKFMKDPTGILPDSIGGQYLVTKSVKTALDRYQRLTSDEGVNAVLKAFDSVQTLWKKSALFSAGYHIRNAAGGMFNSFVAGMNPNDLAKYGAESTKEVSEYVLGKESKMYNEYRRQGLGTTNLSKVEFKSTGEPEKALEKVIKERSRGTVGQVATRLNPLRGFETSREVGDYSDQISRYSLYKWARDKGMTPQQAAAKVREVHFDYSNTTMAEKEIFSRAVPFYRWLRNNVPFQLKQLADKPLRYAAVNKARTNAQNSLMGVDDEDSPQFMKEQFAVPVSESKFLGLNLPLTDLMKLGDPLKVGADSLSPLVKTPLEIASNYNMFKKKPIEKFEGQEKKYEIGGNEFGLPIKTAYALEQLTGQIGRGFSQYIQKEESVDQENKFLTPALGINSILKPYDPEKEAFYRKLKELSKLQDQIDYIEQQTGLRPRTVNDIKKDSK